MSDIPDITYPEILPANDLLDGVGDDVVQTFQLESNALRGRSVRLGEMLDGALSAHDYPPVVAALVAETMTLTVLLASMLKFDGVFTFQAKGDGPVNMLVADMTSDGDVRGCATFDAEALEGIGEEDDQDDERLKRYMGTGYIAFTVDQKGSDRYQGIVELQSTSLIDCAQHYFEQSEQISTGIKVAAGIRNGKWRAGGLMLQQIPEEGGESAAKGDVDVEDDWRRALVLLDSCKDEELLDEELRANELLHRLYHEEGVRVFEPLNIRHQCRCDNERVQNVLSSMSDEDVKDMVVDGIISMRCEFCSHDYRYDPQTLKPIDDSKA